MAPKKGKSAKKTPMMEQYLSIKSRYQDVILLYRMGDFYETFYDDARVISKILGIALTRRAHGKSADVPLAGFPYHSLDNHLPRLIEAGHRVAICEQVEDPKQAKGVVKRDVVEVVTPGTALSEKLLDHKSSNYLAAVYLEQDQAGVSFGDFSTGEFCLSDLRLENLVNYLQEINPREILLPRNLYDQISPSLVNRLSAVITRLDDWIFTHQFAYETLTNHFKTPNLKGFGAENSHAGVIAAGAILHYTRENFQNDLRYVQKLSVISSDDFMILDAATRRNLEITSSMLGDSAEGTLLSALDKSLTPMGGRMMKQMISHPLVNLQRIEERLKRVDCFYQAESLREELRTLLEQIADLERLFARISTGRASPRDLITLKNALAVIEPLRNCLLAANLADLQYFSGNLSDVSEAVAIIETAIADQPPQNITEGGIIRDSYNEELDELRLISREGKDWVVNLQTEEREKTGIPTLKIGYNKVFGYYFEVTRVHQDKVPDYFIRKQTLVNAERFITPQLKEYEEKILGAEERIATLEYDLFQEVRQAVAGWGENIQQNARIIAEMDCLCGLAEAARINNYVKPVVDKGEIIEIEAGRHPVVELLLPPDKPFIDNDTRLENGDTQIMVITGPNMSGKSTYLRQVGLVVLLAQIGSFVPAEKAHIGIVDRIFTRVGASDNLAFGESTFMVEMLEAANILNNATADSLILLDEVGRGTSTFDGMSIAWAMTEYLHHQKKVAAKTLFATHYHELTELALRYPRIKNFRVAVKEYDDHVVFLHKIEAGGMDNSYGIYVAQMAGLPADVVNRAREVLHNLEANEIQSGKLARLAADRNKTFMSKDQLSLFEPAKPSRVEQEIRQLDLNQMTPIDALLKLRELKELL